MDTSALESVVETLVMIVIGFAVVGGGVIWLGGLAVNKIKERFKKDTK